MHAARYASRVPLLETMLVARTARFAAVNHGWAWLVLAVHNASRVARDCRIAVRFVVSDAVVAFALPVTRFQNSAL